MFYLFFIVFKSLRISQLIDYQIIIPVNDYKNRVMKRQTTTKTGLIDYKNRAFAFQTTTKTGFE